MGDLDGAMHMIGMLIATCRKPAMILAELPNDWTGGPATATMNEVITAARAFSAAIEKAYAFNPPQVSLADAMGMIAKAGDVPGGGL